VIDELMATTINKQRLLAQLFATARKESAPAAEPLSVLEQFIYGLCREDATVEQANRAFRNLVDRFFDWNEVRVSSARELEEALEDLSSAEARAQRLVLFLQEVFETHFSYDLQSLEKKGLKDAAKQLSRYQATNDYLGAWVMQRSLGGHAIPLDAPTLRCARRLGLLDGSQDDAETARTSLEHLVPKAKGPVFTDLLSNLSADYCWEDAPNCSACPMSGECPTAHENAALTPVRASRPKPR
jgi:endonuclease III